VLFSTDSQWRRQFFVRDCEEANQRVAKKFLMDDISLRCTRKKAPSCIYKRIENNTGDFVVQAQALDVGAELVIQTPSVFRQHHARVAAAAETVSMATGTFASVGLGIISLGYLNMQYINFRTYLDLLLQTTLQKAQAIVQCSQANIKRI